LAVIVRYTKRAIADLEEARAYIALDQPAATEAMALRIRSAIDGLRQFPERGRPGRLPGTRELVVPRTPFVVPYRVRARRVEILGILHGARAWPDSIGPDTDSGRE
jgi:toxin ParE1/3/4